MVNLFIQNCPKKNRCNDANKEIYRPTYAETNLKFSNLLKEETKFLKNLTNLEKFNFENDFKVNGRRVKDCKVVFDASQILHTVC